MSFITDYPTRRFVTIMGDKFNLQKSWNLIENICMCNIHACKRDQDHNTRCMHESRDFLFRTWCVRRYLSYGIRIPVFTNRIIQSP